VKSWTLIVWGLYLASFFGLATTQIIGLIIAYVKRRDAAGTPFESHMIYAIRTFWIGLGVELIGLIRSVVGLGVGVLGRRLAALPHHPRSHWALDEASRRKPSELALSARPGNPKPSDAQLSRG
jgi:hypothetical protein